MRAIATTRGKNTYEAPHPDDADVPLVTVAKVKGAFRLVALDRRATALGLKPGTPLADARAMHPALDVHESDPEADAAALAALVDWCRLFTPLAAPDGLTPDGQAGIVLDVTGAAHLFGGEVALMDTIVARLEAQGFAAAAAIAATPGAAWALARHGTCRLVPEDFDAARCEKLFAPMPLAALRLDEVTIGRLGQAGLRRIGDLMLRPRAPIAARFGATIHDKLDALLGLAKRPISPRFEAPPFIAERRFAEGIAQREAIEGTILALAHDLCGLLARHGEGARVLDVSLYRVDGVVRHITAGTSRPLRDPVAMARLFHERIEAAGEEGLDTGYGFDMVRLAARAAERLDETQTGWDDDAAEGDLADLIDRLGARFGLARVTRLAPADTHQPEGAAVAIPAGRAAHGVHTQDEALPLPLVGRGRGGGSLNRLVDPNVALDVAETEAHHEPPPLTPPHKGEGKRVGLIAPGHTRSVPAVARGVSASSGAAPKEDTLPERPIRLLERPEPIDTIAAVPDGPPLRFRWRAMMHQVAAIEGPERIGPDWWKQGASPATRDYFRAEDTDGRRFWLYREGLYRDTPAPRWFLHGLFA